MSFIFCVAGEINCFWIVISPIVLYAGGSIGYRLTLSGFCLKRSIGIMAMLIPDSTIETSDESSDICILGITATFISFKKAIVSASEPPPWRAIGISLISSRVTYVLFFGNNFSV